MMNPTYYVSRQLQYYSHEMVVEVAAGGLDFAGSDMLEDRYAILGEGQEYSDPRIAIEVAITIRNVWQKDEPSEHIGLAYGHTGGISTELPIGSREEAREWAQREYDALTKCDTCGAILGKGAWHSTYLPGYQFCSEQCVDLIALEDTTTQL